ncbi:MAG: T9SS type A sorting domain-containing protein [Saprospiraceae bacterium]|nr:T9SS type A sorting domain-containing protein [Lewinella sp.]
MLLFSFISVAQVGCEYQLELYDSFGDGWNGGFLTVTINDKPEQYPFVDGNQKNYSILLIEGDSLFIRFTPGVFPFENSFALFDAEGTEIYHSDQNPDPDDVFSIRVDCPACPNLLSNAMEISDVRHDRVDLEWIQNDPEGTYLLWVVPDGTDPSSQDPIRLAGKARHRVQMLDEHSEYDVYLQTICTNGDTSNQIGPFSFQTLWAKDVGVKTLVSPVSDCGLPADGIISLTIKNYGGAPQTLIPFNYSINGIPGGVMHPNDGVFTGVLSFDSTAVVSFDDGYDFSNPKTYNIKVWTELEGDPNPDNDTLTVNVVHTPLIYEFPHLFDFESGDQGWMLAPESVSASLELGMPSNNVINTAYSGRNAWVTNLNGNYNNRECSMLLSPCFNFKLLDQDPVFSFALFVVTESTFDGVWVETSLDGGPWEKLGAFNAGGSFWYSAIDDKYGDWWSGDNLYAGWRTVSYPMFGFAGKEDVRIRIVFKSDDAVTREGIGIDDIYISQPFVNNLMAKQVVADIDDDCGDVMTPVTFTFRNDGSDTQSSFKVGYQVNDQPVVVETYSGELLPGASASYTFSQTFESIEPGAYYIKAWTELLNEEYLGNDTVTTLYSTAGPGIPFMERFESGEIPDNWEIANDVTVEKGHNSGTYVLFDNLWEEDREFTAVTPLLGPIATGDTLVFKYRFVNFMGMGLNPTVLSDKDSLLIEISTDCGMSFEPTWVIDATNHETRNAFRAVHYPLDEFAGQWIKVRFRVVWGGGDYYFDLDDVNIRRCPPSLNLQATVSRPTDEMANGSIRIGASGGITPYFYSWNTGAEQASLGNLLPGFYEVVVYDQQGCRDELSVILESVVAAEEPESQLSDIRVFPNPNSGKSILQIRLERAYDLQLSLFDVRGRLIRQDVEHQVTDLQYPVDLTGEADGIYFLRVMLENEVRTMRILKTTNY